MITPHLRSNNEYLRQASVEAVKFLVQRTSDLKVCEGILEDLLKLLRSELHFGRFQLLGKYPSWYERAGIAAAIGEIKHFKGEKSQLVDKAATGLADYLDSEGEFLMQTLFLTPSANNDARAIGYRALGDWYECLNDIILTLKVIAIGIGFSSSKSYQVLLFKSGR